MTKAHDVYAYGVIAPSTLYRIRDTFPAAEGYGEIEGVHHMTGGEAANSSIVLARLGATVRLDGNWLGDDACGRRARTLLREYGIDTSPLVLRPDLQSVQEIVFAAHDTRTIFGSYGNLLASASWGRPNPEDITQARVVSLDPFFADSAAQVAAIAAQAGIPAVTVDCRHDDPLLRDVAAVIVASSFHREHYGDHDRAALFDAYLSATDGLVVFTFGDGPLWYGRRGEPLRRCSPPQITAIDTTGAGDSFRAGIVYGFLQSWTDQAMVEFAATVAAINCTRFPGVLQSPSYEEVCAVRDARHRSAKTLS